MNTEPQMTPEQLKIQSLEAEIARLRDKDTKIEYRSKENYEFDKWDLCELSELCLKDNYNKYYYRIAQPKKENKLKKVPLEMSDFDGVDNMFVKDYDENEYIIIKIKEKGLLVYNYERSFKDDFYDYYFSFQRKKRS